MATNADTEEGAKEFVSILGDDKVWLPIGDKSLNRVKDVLPNDQTISQVVYRNFKSPRKLSFHPSILVFTSPSNFESFLEDNTLHQNQKIVAIGNTTSKRIIQEFPHNLLKIANEPTLDELARLVNEYLYDLN